MAVRPTLRYLRDDLRVPLPTARVALDEIDHPILRKAAGLFAAPGTPHERIASIDDVVLFKVKTGRWRGAVFCDEPRDDAQDWLVAAGQPRPTETPLHHDGRHGLDCGARRAGSPGRHAAPEEAAYERDRELLLPGQSDALTHQ